MSRRTRLLIAVVAIGAMASSLALRLFVFPAVDNAGRADAVIVLAGGGPREQFGIQLVVDDVAPHLVFSTSWVDEVGFFAVRSCNARPARLTDDDMLECFVPEPSTTRGEMRHIADLAGEREWDEIVVVASTDQITRARLLLDRCWDGEARFTGPDHPSAWWSRLIYEIGATAKALVLTGC